jgi:hypothetical protein
MHAHSIAWYAAAVFLVAILYRKIAASTTDDRVQAGCSGAASGVKPKPALWAAGLAGCLFLLDKNTYFPVMYVANRGFLISLVFGLLCLGEHHRWRTSQSRFRMWLSSFYLLMSLLANEGGASTLAFLLAYALMLEPGGWRPRFASLLPAAVVVLVWRAVYVRSGFGVRSFLLYLDPGYAPLKFVENLAPRANGLLGGQLTGLPPELSLALNAKWQMLLAIFFAGFGLLCAAVFWPVLRRDRVTRFWATVMLLALIPAATVAPVSKNLGFVAVGAFGAIASFLVHFAVPEERAVMSGPIRAMSWFVAVWLLVAHVPVTLAARAGLAMASPSIPQIAARACAFEHSPDLGDRHVVVVNDPTMTALMVPFARAYSGQPLPRSIRTLIPGSVRFQVSRADASTLIFTAMEGDLFDCPALPPVHLCYALKAANTLLFGAENWKAGDQVARKGFVAEILEMSPRGAPRSIAFHFDTPLESERVVWIFFDWRRFAHRPFVPPQLGETIMIQGPRGVLVEPHQ